MTGLFERDAARVLPTERAVGPWRPDALHGAAIAALFGAVLDDPESGSTVARVTLDLLASVPVAPLRLELEEPGGSRRVRRRTAVLSTEDREVARATALWANPSPLHDLPPAAPADPPPGDLAPLPEGRAGWPGFESQAMALRVTGNGDRGMRGWFRLLHPALAGEAVTGLQLALAAADYTSGGTTTVLDLAEWTFMSVDLTVNLVRVPVGDWVGIEARSLVAPTGVGTAMSVLHDADGPLGHCTQTQFIQPR
jgi:hypothetical protein